MGKRLTIYVKISNLRKQVKKLSLEVRDNPRILNNVINPNHFKLRGQLRKVKNKLEYILSSLNTTTNEQ